MRKLLGLSILALAACAPGTEDAERAPAADSRERIPVEPDSGTGAGAPPIPETATRTAAPNTFARTMPQGLRGDWHKDDLGRAPTKEDCDPRLRGTIDWDRLITVRDNGYSYFETGGRIMEVHNRTDTMIDATFDTTYADDPTSERRDFILQPDGTMAINNDDGDGILDVTQYRRCPR